MGGNGTAQDDDRRRVGANARSYNPHAQVVGAMRGGLDVGALGVGGMFEWERECHA